MTLTQSETEAVETLVDYLSETTPPDRNCPPRHHAAHQALVLLAVAAGFDGQHADEILARTWRDRLNVQRDLDRLAELEKHTDSAGHPFDPALPGHLDQFIAAWQTSIGTDQSQPLGTVRGTDNEWHTVTLADLIQLRDRIAYAEKTRAELAEKCHTYRGQLDKARATAPQVWAIDSSWWDRTRLCTTQEAARALTEAYISKSAARKPIAKFEWRPVEHEPDTLELIGTLDGEEYPANMWIFPVTPDDTMALDAEDDAESGASNADA